MERVVAYIANVNADKSNKLCVATGGVDFPEDERRWMYVMSCHGADQEGWEGFEDDKKEEDNVGDLNARA